MQKRFRETEPKGRNLLVVYLFIIGLVVPIQVFVGPLRLSPYRVVLLVMLVPLLIMVLRGSAGRIKVADLMILLHCVWVALALIMDVGIVGAAEPAGIHFVQTAGSYFLARAYIRSTDDLYRVVRFLCYVVIFFIPFSAIEAVTGKNVFLIVMGPLTTFAIYDMESRWGLQRAQGAFEHPILYGVFCSSMLAAAYYVLGHGKRLFKAALAPMGVVAATFFSLSSGPFTALIMQFALIGWDKMTRRVPSRWLVLGGLFGLAYLVVDLISNRSPIRVFIAYLTFNQGNAWNRIHIWNFGTAEIARNPLFGIGLDEWQGGWWMSQSMDNFWLATAVRYGLPAFILYAGAGLLIGWQVGRMSLSDGRTADYRKGLLIALVGLAIAGSTVHFWNATFCLFTFLVGAAVWITDAETRAAVPAAPGTQKPEGMPTQKAAPANPYHSGGLAKLKHQSVAQTSWNSRPRDT